MGPPRPRLNECNTNEIETRRFKHKKKKLYIVLNFYFFLFIICVSKMLDFY